MYVTGGSISASKCFQMVLETVIFNCEERSSMLYARKEHTLTCLSQRFLLACGGSSVESSSMDPADKVEQYSIEGDTWHELPSLNVGRYRASSCSIGTKAFVFCGISCD